MKKQSALLDCVLALVLGVAGFFFVVVNIDIGGDYPNAASGPGMTLDEPFNIGQGVYLNRSVREFGVGIFSPTNASAVFENEAYMSDYPPLGRLWLGAWHDITLWISPVENMDNRIVMSAARVGSAVAFGLLLSLITWTGLRWYGRVGGITAGLFLLMMPRIFGHAHIGSVETIMNLTWTITVLAVIRWWIPNRRIATVGVIITGMLFGIAMLTKIQGVLLSVPIALWALMHWKHRAIVPLAIFGFVAAVTFIVLWPWMWFDPIPRGLEYLGRATKRVTLHAYYLGTRYKDTEVPWHYPFVMFAVTMPIGILATGLFGSITGLRNARERLLLLCAVFPMALFAVPGVTVYDGIRLFLVSCPLWALLAAHGVEVGYQYCAKKFNSRCVAIATGIFVLAQGYGLAASTALPLSYYSMLTGGLSGAEAAGFETTYWNDCLTREFMDTIPDNATVHIAPVLHPGLPMSLLDQYPGLSQRQVQLRAFDYELDTEDGYLLLVNRRADLPARWQKDRDDIEIVSEMAVDGVPLARLVKIKSR